MSKNEPPQDTDPTSTTDLHDGFDLIEYPSDYLFKAMYRVADDAPDASEFVRGVILQHVASDALQSMKTNPSRTGKFVAVSATVTLQSRDQLETIYASIAASPQVVMTL